jgi:hypothetical protein
LGLSIDEDTILAHLLNSLPKDYGSLQQAQRSLLEVETETVWHVMVELLKIAIRNAYKDMKSTSKDPEEAFFAKKFKGTCNKCDKQGHKGTDCWSKQEGGSSAKKTEGGGGGADKRTCFKCKKPNHIKANCPGMKTNKDTDDTGMFLGMAVENNSDKQVKGNDYFESLFEPDTFCKSCEKVENKSENLGGTIEKSDPTKRRQETATKVFQWADCCDESEDEEEDSCTGSIQGEVKGEKNIFCP